MLLEQALKLPVAERAKLVSALLKSLDGEPDTGVEAAWLAELRVRDTAD